MKIYSSENTRIGFIGIGSMGSRMAKRLLAHGYRLAVYDRHRQTAEALVEHGATVADSLTALSSQVDVIMSSLTNDDAVRSVYNGAGGVFAGIRRGTAIIDLSTVLPATSRELSQLSGAAGTKFLDAPVSGSTPSAENGTLTVFCGGDEQLFNAAQTIFRAIASQNFYLGSSGSGTAMKLVVNTLLGVGIQAIAESVALGQKQGLDRHRLLEVLSHTAVVAPAHMGKLALADLGDYRAQFALGLMNKDFRLILETAAAVQVPMPATAAAFQINTAEFDPETVEDFSAVIKGMEKLARVNVPGTKPERMHKLQLLSA